MFEKWENWVHEHLSSPWLQLLIATAIGFFIGFIIATILQSIGKRSKRKVVRAAAQNLRSVALIIGTMIGINIGLRAFDFRPDTMITISNGFTFGILMIITWAATHVYDSIHAALVAPWGKKTDNSTLVDVGHTVINVLIWLIGMIAALSSAGLNVSSVLAGLGIGGLAIALAAQDAVSNIFGGVVILTQTPFKVGDKITITGITGWVTSIGIRATTIHNWYGHKVTLPNKIFTNNAVSNVDSRGEYWEEIKLRLRHDTTLEQIEAVMERIKKILSANDNLRDTIWVGVNLIGEGFIQIEGWYGTISFLEEDGQAGFPNEYDKILSVKSDINMQMLRALEEEGIKLATPIATHINYQGPIEGGRV